MGGKSAWGEKEGANKILGHEKKVKRTLRKSAFTLIKDSSRIATLAGFGKEKLARTTAANA